MVEKVEIYFIRHGESTGNKEDRFRGQHDFELNETGIDQAEALKNELSGVNFITIYSSPLKRALKTASILAGRTQTLKIEEGFTNIHLGSWENRRKDEIRKQYPDLWKLWLIEPEKLFFPGMETLAEVRERSWVTLQKILSIHGTGPLGIVTHRAVLKPLFAAMLDIPEPYFWKFHLDTASYSIAEYRPDRGFTFTSINQTRHMKSFIREDLG
ncbi:MAG: histidine phosphatase family protein [Calditrichaeota bacterium]|nr:histidine phosphatase family protein [Calditrichota bacterium]RQV99441.1 MAG: histidine phosphatase family protein [Calditrichota bacterium]